MRDDDLHDCWRRLVERVSEPSGAFGGARVGAMTSRRRWSKRARNEIGHREYLPVDAKAWPEPPIRPLIDRRAAPGVLSVGCSRCAHRQHIDLTPDRVATQLTTGRTPNCRYAQ